MIRRLPGRERWRAPELSHAPRIAPPEDRVSTPADGTPAPAVRAGGIRWSETMAGMVKVDGTERSARFAVAISIPDVSAFVAHPSHTGNAAGTVEIAGLTGQGGAPVEGGSFHLSLDDGDPRARAMTYTLPFHDAAGRRWTLRGVKDVRGRGVLDFWRATTTLAVRLEPDGGDTLAASGQMRLGVRAVTRLVGSMRPVRAGRRSDPPLALLRFVRFFAGTLLGLYLAGRREPRT
jgi:hypothetical protein